MIKIYDLLFEQDTTSTTSSNSSSSNGIDPTKLGDVVKKAVGDAVGKPLSSIQAWIKQNQKATGKPKVTPSNAESTTGTTGTKASGPSNPPGVVVSQQQKPTGKNEQPLNPTDIKSIADEISKNIQSKNS